MWKLSSYRVLGIIDMAQCDTKGIVIISGHQAASSLHVTPSHRLPAWKGQSDGSATAATATYSPDRHCIFTGGIIPGIKIGINYSKIC